MNVKLVWKIPVMAFDSAEFGETAMIDYPGPASPGVYTVTEWGVLDTYAVRFDSGDELPVDELLGSDHLVEATFTARS